MSSATVRISLAARDRLRDLAAQTGKPMQRIVEDALELYRRRCFLEEVNSAYRALREDSQAWSELAEERAAWESTLGDGLSEE